MKKKFVSNMDRIEKKKDEDIDFSDCPPITEEQLKKAVLRHTLKPIERKTRINIMLSGRVVSFFKAKAKGRGYQTLINNVLEEAIEREAIEELFRRIIREELDGKKRKKAA